jgi:hypothetical protein
MVKAKSGASIRLQIIKNMATNGLHGGWKMATNFIRYWIRFSVQDPDRKADHASVPDPAP